MLEQPLVLVGLEAVLGDDLGRDGGIDFGVHATLAVRMHIFQGCL